LLYPRSADATIHPHRDGRGSHPPIELDTGSLPETAQLHSTSAGLLSLETQNQSLDTDKVR
jgi:hypothetical protein